jgi:HEAT repeat protein
MIDPKLEPDDIYAKRQQLGLGNSIRMLSEIIDVTKNNSKRIEAIKYLGLMCKEDPSLGKECFDTLENVLISEEGTSIKCEAAKSLGKLRLEKGLKPLIWILDQDFNDPEIYIAALKSIGKIRFEQEETKLFVRYLDSGFNSIKNFVKNKLLDLEPAKLIHSLVSALKDNSLSNKHKSEIIKLMGYEISSINISLDDISYIKTKYPEIISDLVNNKNVVLNEISRVLREEDKALMDSIVSTLSIILEHIKDDIIKLLLTDDFIVKKNAIIITGKLKIRDAVDSLVDNLDSMYNEVTRASIEALGEIGDISAVPELLSILNIEDISFEYTDIDMKFQVIDAIKSIYLNSEVASYAYLLDDLNGQNETIKESVAFILGEIGNEEFASPLIKAMDDRNLDVKKNIIIALGKIGQTNSLNELISVLNDDSTYWLIKKVAADAIYNIFQKNWYKLKDTESELWRSLNKDYARLIDFLKNNDEEDYKVKISTIKILEKFGDDKAINALMTRVNDFHRVVRIHASNAIKKIEERLELEEQSQ